jgi:hypothetical protein
MYIRYLQYPAFSTSYEQRLCILGSKIPIALEIQVLYGNFETVLIAPLAERVT